MEGGEGPDETENGSTFLAHAGGRIHRGREFPVRRRARGAHVVAPELPHRDAWCPGIGSGSHRGDRRRGRRGLKLAGGALADDPHRRRTVAIGGYTTTAVLSSAIGLATTPLQVAVLRTGAWAARGIRGPSRNALLADLVPSEAYGRAYGFERMMDNFGAIVGPLLALLLVSIVGVRQAILRSIVPGLLAAVAIVYAARHVARPDRPRAPSDPTAGATGAAGQLGELFIGMGAFEFGNAAATLMILRASELLTPSHGEHRAAQLALLLYVGYNVAARFEPAWRAPERSPERGALPRRRVLARSWPRT